MSSYSLDEFFQACGGTGPLRLTVDGERRAAEYVLPQPFAVAGTDPRADLRRPDPAIARRAAYLQVVDGRLLCLDLTGGRNGGYPPHGWLDPGRVWSNGPIPIRLASDSTEAPSTRELARREELPPIAVEITGGSGGTCRYRIKVPLVLIGKSSQCQVRLRDAAVSRFHCALVHTRAGLWAVDLLGRGGIAVNGATVRAGRLDDGDVLRVGGFTFRPQLGPPTDLVPRESPSGPIQISSLPATAPQATTALAIEQFGQSPLVALFAALHQQMAEQMRLTVTELLGSFQRMHSDQMKMVWDELAQIRRLSEEVTSLKAAQAQPRPTLPPQASIAGPTPRPLEQAPQPPPTVAANPQPPRPFESPPRDPGPVIPAAAARAEPKNDDNVHDWVSRRIAEVQRERDGRWQKIVSFLTGSTP